jgi:hypothetical protein
MKKTSLRALIYMVLGIFVVVQSCTCSNEPFDAIRFDESKDDPSAPLRYVQDEIIVTYKGIPTPQRADQIKAALIAAGIDTSTITIRRCNSCGAYIELWHAEDIHSVIHEEGIRGGTVSGGSQGVGEDSLAKYSLNYLQRLPTDKLPSRREYKVGQSGQVDGAGKDTILIAVLDTGVDTTQIVNGNYVWKNKKERAVAGGDHDGNCYADDVSGWNFVDGNNNIQDNNLNLHGTIVSQYIINEFLASPNNFVQVMALKTHDQNGSGDLFSSICAIHYAIDKGARIINASWGFYYYQDDPHPYLDSLITTGLMQKGILFVTAAGNKIDQIDQQAKAMYQSQHGVAMPDSLLRNLEFHNFYPACLSRPGNNVVTVTTTDGSKISPTQNYASRYVDVGVKADTVDAAGMRFRLTFAASPLYISGSSFATAIATGKIGALTPVSSYIPNLNKATILDPLTSGGSPSILTWSILESQKRIAKGRYTKRE